MTCFLKRVAVCAMLVSSLVAFSQKKPAPAAATSIPPSPPIRLMVDATRAPEKFLHAQMQIPVQPGKLTLVYPKWIPGEHAPTGPIADLTGVQFFANGQRLTWRRNLEEMFSFELIVPAGVNMLEVRLDTVLPAAAEGFSSGASSTAQLDLVSWNQLLLYPLGRHSDDILFTAALKLPEGWHYGTALPVENESGNQINFRTTSLTTLVDSPVISGRHFRRIPLSPQGPIQHYLDIAADSDAALAVPPDVIEHYKRLVAETGALYTARHYREYHFLLTLSDKVAHFGLEHHESSDDRVGERTMIEDDDRLVAAALMPHEMTHSWNGKFRRPAGLATSDYQKPMQGDLLWVYEGLTQYLGEILTARSGLWTKDQFLEEAAETAAVLDNTPGRSWRPLQDTADAAQVLYGAAPQFGSWRRGVDYYPEGFLIWLDVDTTIRRLSHGEKSINDFCRLFHGGPDTPPMVVTYTFDGVVNTLNQVAANDWKKFLRDRLDTYGPGAPLDGITNGGWKLVYDDQRGEVAKATEKVSKTVDARFSLGLSLDEKASVIDVIANSPAWNVGIAPGTTLVAVNGRKFSADILREALQESKRSGQNLDLLMTNGDFFRNYTPNYHDGEKYPHLVRDESKPDVLGEIIKPMTK
ncbi:MAG TPA: hypothetical protein VNW97_08700 [Candidatus Saccharimonadales bacterium]|jgi:predicted metalloprotease with PDZ domain|nr:hypothetical protein [Candidatus Saccharimonadales bacterium]